MTNEKINIAIAEACGWTEIAYHKIHAGNEGLLGTHTTADGARDRDWVPDYCADLNAMHEAEKTMLTGFEDSPESSLLWSDYLTNLIIACPAYLSYHATARQRAEAFLRTIGKWEEAAK